MLICYLMLSALRGSSTLGVYSLAHINMCLCVPSIFIGTSACLLTRLLEALSHSNEHEVGHDTSAMHYLANDSVAGVGVLVLRPVSRRARAALLTSTVTSSSFFSPPCFSLRDQQFCFVWTRSSPFWVCLTKQNVLSV